MKLTVLERRPLPPLGEKAGTSDERSTRLDVRPDLDGTPFHPTGGTTRRRLLVRGQPISPEQDGRGT
jgi:hypothetical protein